MVCADIFSGTIIRVCRLYWLNADCDQVEVLPLEEAVRHLSISKYHAIFTQGCGF